MRAQELSSRSRVAVLLSTALIVGAGLSVASPLAAAAAPPTANDDLYSVPAGSSLSVFAPGILANDTDPDVGDTLTAVLTLSPAGGDLTLNPSGSFFYRPHPGYAGVDSFSYRADDGETQGNEAVVIISVTNAAPSAVGESYTVTTGLPFAVVAPGILANDLDADGNSLTAVLATPPANGTLDLEPDGSFVYTSTPGFIGSDSFTYQAHDGTWTSGWATVTLAVVAPPNVPPVGVDDDYSTPAGTTLVVAAPGVVSNDTDANGHGITVLTVIDEPEHGTLVLNVDGSFAYEPDPGHTGADTFTYRPSDGSGMVSNITTVTITTLAAPAPSADGSGGLPPTGALLPSGAAGGALALLVLGSGVLIAARRRRTS